MSKTRQKKRRPLIDLALIGGILGLIGIILLIVITKDDMELLETKATAIDSIKTEEASSFPEVTIVSEKSTDSELPFVIQYPKVADEKFNIFIEDHIQSTKDAYIQKLVSEKQERKNKENKLPNNLNIHFDTFQYEDIYYSFVFTEQQAVKNSAPTTSTTTIFYNAESGKIIDIRTLLGDDMLNLETFANHVRSLLKSDESLTSVLNLEEVDHATEPRWILFNKFAIFDGKLHIYFDEGTIAPKEAGTITISVTMSFLNPLLASEFQMNMIEVEAPEAPLDPNRKLVALTFDDGPHPEVTSKILNSLDQYNAKATFYMLGNRIEMYPEIAKEVLARGHEIGNHTWSHPVLPKLSAEQVMSEYNTTEKVIMDVLGQPSKTFRPPYGATNDSINNMIPREIVIWSIDTLDWKHRNADKLLQNVKEQIHNHAIILMHDIHPSTADGIPKVLDYLSKEGYEFVTVTEILKYQQ